MAKKKQVVVEEPVEEVSEVKVLKFTKEKFVNSKRFAARRDIVNALLDEDKTYSIEEVENIINDFLRGNKK